MEDSALVTPLIQIQTEDTVDSTPEKKGAQKKRGDFRTSPLYSGKGTWSSVKVDLAQRTVSHHVWDKIALGAYRRFLVLTGERLHANVPVEQRQTISFLDLPAEIRNRIYSHVLDFGSLELAAISSYSDKSNSERVIHYRDYRKHVKPALKLLRLNKQINAEASSVFYGVNEFRFSGVCGHDVLLAFCKTIGKANTRRLTKVTEHAPFDAFWSLYNRPANDSKTCRFNFDYWVYNRGLHKKGHLAGKFSVACAITGKGGSLKEYRLVVPSRLDLLDGCKMVELPATLLGHIESAQAAVKITLVLLDMDTVTCSLQIRLRRRWAVIGEEKGWEVVEAVSDKLGRYEDCASARAPVPSLEDEDGR